MSENGSRQAVDQKKRDLRDLAIFVAGVAYKNGEEVGKHCDPSLMDSDVSKLIASMSPGSRDNAAVVQWFAKRGANIGDGRLAVEACGQAMRDANQHHKMQVIARTLTFRAGETPTEYKSRLQAALDELTDAGV